MTILFNRRMDLTRAGPFIRTETGDAARLLAMTVSPPQMGIWALNPLAAAQA
jgi:hypothetical protein